PTPASPPRPAPPSSPTRRSSDLRGACKLLLSGVRASVPRRLTLALLAGVPALLFTTAAYGRAGAAKLHTNKTAPFVNKVGAPAKDRKSTRLNSSHVKISYAVFCL